MAGLVLFLCFAQIVSAGGQAELNTFGFVLVVPEAEVEKVKVAMASNRAFINEKYSVDGDMNNRMNSSSAIKMQYMNGLSDPSKGMMGNVV